MINRRGFLKGMLGLAAAPAICKAENLMKIFVPSQELIIPDQNLGRGMTNSIIHIDEAGFLGGDFDGDTISFHELTDYTLSHQILSQKHMLPEVVARQERERKAITDYVNKTSLLKQRLSGKTVYATRSPITGSGVIVTL